MIRASLATTLLRFLTWGCVVFLAILSLLPAQAMVRTGLPGQFEHFVAYAGSAAIATAGYGLSRGSMLIIGAFWGYADQQATPINNQLMISGRAYNAAIVKRTPSAI